MHLAVTGAVEHLYHIQRALDQGGGDWAWILKAFHREVADWRNLPEQMAAWPMHLDKIVR